MAVAEIRTGVPVAEGKPNALKGMTRLPVIKQMGLLIGLAASVALGIAIVQWSQTPGYSLLYGALSTQSVAEVVSALEAVNIPYRVDKDSGAMMVPSGKVHEARMKLAAQGLPRSTAMGFEILEKEQGFGTSQFVERARFQRALEVELARTIGNLNHVKSARVHLAVPKQSVFVRNRKQPSASVLVHLYSGRTLEEEQVSAISHMVAASVPNMDVSGVKVIDHKGRLLSAPEQSPDAVMSRTQFDYTRRVEADLNKRIMDILTPLVGSEGVRAQVAANMDFTRTEQTRETYNPDLPALRSEQVTEEQGSAASIAGIPGALSNQPPGAATAPEEAEGIETADGGESTGPSRRHSTRNYELDKTISHTTTPAVSIRRL
ncbi:MAG: flagellar M-ring protein FliF, partial [Gammaproteobacteria bacterium]|nr:flagellar M-ring protein FliF [Gammaproteobacteria bacterium]